MDARSGDLAEHGDLVVLSPHLDDAALSVGGLVHRCARRGGRVLVATCCTAAPGPEVRARLPRWLAPAADLETRQAEDLAALQRLGAEPRWLGLPDGAWLLPRPTRRSLFARCSLDTPGIRARQPRLVEALAGLLAERPRALVLCPLGLGGHVDHRAVLAAGLEAARAAGQQPFFYADVYAVLAPDSEDCQVERLGLDLEPRPQRLGPGDEAAKLEAAACYASQHALLGGFAHLRDGLRRQHEREGGAEPVFEPREVSP